VIKVAGRLIGEVYYLAVRLFGWIFWLGGFKA